jgi:hypothetical protein
LSATIVTSIITGGANSHATSSAEANAVATDFVTQGIIGSYTNTAGVAPNTGSYAVNAQASPAMFVDVTAGTAYITATPSSQTSQSLRAYMSANYTSYAISANSSGSTKYDWIYLKVDPTKANSSSAAADDVTALFTSRSSSNTTDNGSPPTYGILLAIVTVANGASTISNSQIQDKRTPATLSSPTTAGWTASIAPTTVAALGNRSYSLTFTATDLTGTISNGTRIRTTRTTSAPTQCTSLNGTTQYYSKTSPSGMTFTDDFVVSAWVKLTQYGATSVIASRNNGTSGWWFYINTSGQVTLRGDNAGSGNTSNVSSYQSIPLNKWVHVAAQLDMSTFTATTTTSYVMIDGVDVPATVARAGTNPTALVQAGNLEIGSYNTGSSPFPGKIAQVAIYSAKVTQANVLATMAQGLAGTETSLISAYSFNNSINDLNGSNANNLTANGSAVATNSDSPFGNQADGTISSTLDYAIVTKTAFSTDTTLTVQVPEGCTIPTSGGVSAMSYSGLKAPYGMPVQKDKWRLRTLLRLSSASAAVTSNATYGSYLSGGYLINVPIGNWTVGMKGNVYNTSTTTVNWNLSPTSSVVGLSNTAGYDLSPISFASKSAAASTSYFYGEASNSASLTSATTYTVYTFGATTSAGLEANTSICELYAELALL